MHGVLGLAACGAMAWLAVAVPPLSLEGYLDEKLPAAPAEPADHFAPNEPCYVCHGNLREDALVQKHGRKKVGCIKCHGASENHRNDEDNIIPPDKMFGGDAIDRLCRRCHKKHDVPARKVVERLRARKLEAAPIAELTCNACHFNHRLAHRTVRWDRTTGKVLSRAALDATNAPETNSR